MTVQQLQYVLEVNKAGSITKAAKNLFITPSSISAAIASLEKELGYTLFVRTWQGAQPTQKGLQVIRHADYICERLRLIEDGNSGPVEKPFRVLAGWYPPFDNAFNRLVQERQKQFQGRFILDKLDNRFVAMDQLVSGAVDLVVMAAVTASLGRFDYNAAKRKLAWECRMVLPGVLRIGPGHRLYEKANVTMEDFRNEVLIDGPSLSTFNSTVLRDKVPMNPYRAVLHHDVHQRYELVSQGLGYTLGAKLPEHTEQKYRLRSIPVPGLEYHLITVTNPAHEPCPEALRYLELLDEELADV